MASIPFNDIKQYYYEQKEDYDKCLEEIFASGMFICGAKTKEFENALAQYVGMKHCISCSNGTVALHLALLALDIKPGDEVITVPFTWISTAEVIELCNAKTVFVDIEEKTYNIDVSKIEAAITPKTKAIIPVSLFGQMPDYDAINEIAKKHNIVVIEDAAQSFGATQRGKRSCGVTKISCTSFYPSKPLGAMGEGGACFTNDDTLATRLLAARQHGGVVRHQHEWVGTNARINEIQGALLGVKFKKFPEHVEKREKLGKLYNELLSTVPGVIIPEIAEGNTHVWAQYSIRTPGKNRDEIVKELTTKHGIPICVFYPKCLHLENVFGYLGHKEGSFPVSEKVSHEIFQLPMHPFLTEEQIHKIVNAVREVMK